ncbi:cell envelope integrity protein TolA [Maricaulis sp.]|uniref:cell envelope integrity protein TolA n=1 Tax=Maricaulis sp. TaxID=1486257 RepID=UPI0026170398|nr:cell envelope integrity protein TolA [Maricaulis sp.]
MRGVVLSLLVHAGILAAGLVYLPRAAQVFEDTPIVPVELVTVAERTNVRAAAPEPEPEPEEAVEDTVEDEIETPEPQPEPEPEPARAEPEPIDPEPEPEPEPAETQPEPVEEAPEPEPARETPPVRPEQRRDTTPSLEDMLGNIERQVAEVRRETGTPDEGERRRSAGAGDAMTATLQDLIQSHLARCWRNSLDAPDPDELAVEVVFSLNRNGELAGPPRLVDQARVLNSPNPYLRVAGERALRAATQCAPYPLPPEYYSQWRQITVNFAPSLYSR